MRLGRWAAIAFAIVVALTVARAGWVLLGFLKTDPPGPPLIALTLETKPPGAEIWLDGFPLGKVTPATLQIDNALAHEVELRLEGWMKARRTIPSGQPGGTLAVELRKAGEIQVRSDPPGASVTVGDEILGTTPCTVEVTVESPTRITATLDGYLPETSVITVATGEVIPWVVRLRPSGKLDISSDPPAAMASVDGQPVGQTPQSVWVEAGTPHLVQIDLGKLRASRVVSVAARATRGVELRIDDTDDQRLQVSLQMTEKQLERLRGRMARLNQHHPNQLGEALATTHHEELLEEEVDRLEQREQEIEGTLAAHRTELEDRARTQPAR